LTVSFTAGNDGGSPITNYEYSTDGGATFRAFSPVDTTSPVVITTLSLNGTTQLVNGTTYNVQLRAVNINGSGAPSATVQGTPANIPNVPAAPTGLSGVGGNEAIYVLFTPGNDGGSPITNYEYSIDGGPFIAFSPAQTFSPVQISGLQNEISYSVVLRAVNSVGSGANSSSISVIPTITTLNMTNLLIQLDADNSSSYSGSGNTWTNLQSGGQYSATLQNNPSFNNINKYFTFDGNNQIAQIPAIPATSIINPTRGSSFTLQIWARVNTASPNFSSGDGLISKQFGLTGGYDGYSLSLNKSTNAVILNMNGSSVNGNYPSSANVYSNIWALYTIVVRFGGGTGNPSYTYVSTRRVITAANNENGIPNQAPLQFPRGIQETGSNFCPADVGAFYLYNTALSQEDIIRNYDATKSRYNL
jgi:hypothetical protein